MPDRLAEIRYEVSLASRILANENVLDAFGHVSLRHPSDPNRYLLSRSRSPELVEAADVLEYDLNSQPVTKPAVALFAERVIHGEIYKARPDVMAVVHHHAPAVMPFAIVGMPIIPVFHLGAAGGEMVPFWDQRDDFGDTNLLVREPAEGASLALALGPHAAVLMRGHGATVVGGDLRELVSRAVFMCRNAEFQLQARLLGRIIPLSPGEIRKAGSINALPNVTGRTWEYWSNRLAHAGKMPPPATAKASARRKSAPAKAANKKPSQGKGGRAMPRRKKS